MKHLSPEDVARRYYDAFNRRRFDEAERLVEPQATFFYPHSKDHLVGRAGYRALADAWIRAFPDARIEIERLTTAAHGEDHLVVADLVGRGTHSGPLDLGGQLTLPPSGRSTELRFREELEIHDGCITDAHLHFNVEELLRRLTEERRSVPRDRPRLGM